MAIATAEGVRLGVLVPSINVVVEPDFYRMAPRHVSIHFTRMAASSAVVSPEILKQFLDHLEEALTLLADAEVSAVALACTSASFYKGLGGDEAVITRAEKIVRPATTTSTAVIAALQTLGMRRIGVATPYPEEINALLVSFLEGHGVEVADLQALEGLNPETIPKQPASVVYQLAKSVASPAVEGVFVSCTGFPAIEIIDGLEREIGKPVVTANQAAFWHLLRLANVSEKINGYGELLRRD
jgi:maleate isomerase